MHDHVLDPTIRSLGTLLGVWAHPDDEAYLSAGLMALARRSRQRVVVVTATAGEGGAPPGARWSPRRAARVRGRELDRSLRTLGVVEHFVAGYGDGRCASVAPEDGAALVGRWMRYVRPDTVVTFGPDGITGHPDHRAVSGWVRAAWAADGHRARLLHPTLTPDFHRRWGPDLPELGFTGDAPRTPDEELALRIDCTGALLERKVQALQAHRSQMPAAIRVLGEDGWRSWFATEAFVEARPQEALASSPAGRDPALAAR